MPAGHESPSGAFKAADRFAQQMLCVQHSKVTAISTRWIHEKMGLLAPFKTPKAVRLHTKKFQIAALKDFFVFRRFRVAYATSCTGKFVLYLLRG